MRDAALEKLLQALSHLGLIMWFAAWFGLITVLIRRCDGGKSNDRSLF